MKIFQWLFEDVSSEVHIRAEYAQTPDSKFIKINPAELTPVGLKCYREELERRKLTRPQITKTKR